jgi:hypothetical protein
MTLYIWLIFSYEIFQNIQTEFSRRAKSSPMYNLSALERKLWKDNSALSLFAMLFLLVIRINGIAFLVYLGFTTVWWHPIALWGGGLIGSVVAISLFKGPTGLTIPSLLAYLVLPIVGVVLWFSV